MNYTENVKEFLKELNQMIGSCEDMIRISQKRNRDHITRGLKIVLADLYEERDFVKNLKIRRQTGNGNIRSAYDTEVDLLKEMKPKV